MRVAVGAIARNPDLAKCTAESLFSAVVQSATLGLEPNGPLGEAYLVPYRNPQKGVTEVQFQPGYRGLIKLSRNSGDVSLFYADKICANDTYNIKRGLHPDLTHEIALTDRGDAIAYYAVFHLSDNGGEDFEVMTVQEIEKIRGQSKSGQSPAWRNHFDEMAKKTVLKRLAKRAPMSIELATAVNLDNQAAMGDRQDLDLPDGVTVDVLPITSPYEEGGETGATGVNDGTPAPEGVTGTTGGPPADEAPLRISQAMLDNAIRETGLTTEVVLNYYKDQGALDEGQAVGSLPREAKLLIVQHPADLKLAVNNWVSAQLGDD
jgi:phage RecT family recombinase